MFVGDFYCLEYSEWPHFFYFYDEKEESTVGTIDNQTFFYFGELKSNLMNGRGIRIDTNGNMTVGYWKNGSQDSGNYISLKSVGINILNQFPSNLL